MPKIITAILVLGFLAGGAYAYQAFRKENPEAVVKQVWANVYEAKSYRFNGKLHSIEKTSVNASPDVNGEDASISEEVSVGVSGSYDKSGEKAKLAAEVAINSGDGDIMLEFRVLDSVLYAMVKDIKIAEDETGIGGLADMFKNKWVSIELGEEAENSPVDIPYLSLTETVKKLTPEEQAALKNLVKEVSFIKVTGQSGSENMGGVDTSRYTIMLEKAELSEYFERIIVFLKGIPAERAVESEIAEVEEFKKEAEKITAGSGEVWIGKKDKLPYRIVLSVSQENVFETLSAASEISLELSLSEWNMPIDVVKPEGVQDLMSIFSSSFGDFDSSASSGNTKTEEIEYPSLNDGNRHIYITLGQQLGGDAQFYYHQQKTFSGFCSDAQAKKYIAEIDQINIKKGIKHQVCKDTAADVVLSSPFPEGPYYCILVNLEGTSTNLDSHLLSKPPVNKCEN